ncbi:MAG: ROK family protein [bacterium]|nr:ROK family protein [bacterium]
MERFVVGIDLGGTKVEACLMDSKGKVYDRKRRPVEAYEGPRRVLGNALATVAQVSEGRHVEAVGIGTPGTYVSGKGRLYGSPHTPVYETPGFIGELRDMLAVPLLVENDANCLALAEYFTSCKGTYGYVMAVVLGTGMGCGLILDNKLYVGAKGGAGEIGHTTVDFNGRLCECGRKGCAEAYLSGPAISRRFHEICGQKKSVPEIYQLYCGSFPPALQLMEQSLTIMGEVFANAVNAFDLEAIVLGGGVSNLPIWYNRLPLYMNRSFFGVPRAEIPLIKANMGDSAGVLGAAYLALRHLELMDF